MSSSSEGDMGVAVVIDPGSGSVRAGMAGEDAPRTVFPNVVGRPRFQREISNTGQCDPFVGDDAANKAGVLSLKYPIEYGIVTNWDDMERVFHHTFYNELRISPSDHPVLLTEPALNPRANRQKLTQVMFETFEVPAFLLKCSPVLSLFAEGKTTGAVLQCGEGMTMAVPVYEGCSLPYTIPHSFVSGRDLTDYLMRLLNDNKKYMCSTTAERKLVKDMKEKFGFVSLNVEDDMEKSKWGPYYERKYELPDGSIVILNDERFRCAEPLFDPSLVGIEMYGIQYDLHRAIMRAEESIRDTLFSYILPAGGNTLFPGFGPRLQKEIRELVPASTPVQVLSREHGLHSTWIGGSVLASLPSTSGAWITKDEYDEYGPVMVERKCF